jgi:FixJ family two-component response regulator
MPDASRFVCIVDDDQFVRRALKRLMQSHQYESIAFASGRECLDGHEVDRADALIVDVSMPGMDGFELHTLLRASGRNIPTIFISAHINRNYASRAKAVGAVAFVDKPCDEAELLGAVELAISAKSRSSAARSGALRSL